MFEIVQLKKKKKSRKKGGRKRKRHEINNSSHASLETTPNNCLSIHKGKKKKLKHIQNNEYKYSNSIDKGNYRINKCVDNFKYNFPGAEFLDHFETPLIAYKDIVDALDIVAKTLKKDRANLRIYDPFYCRGSVKKYLYQLGFTNVYNKNEDFYSSQRYEEIYI